MKFLNFSLGLLVGAIGLAFLVFITMDPFPAEKATNGAAQHQAMIERGQLSTKSRVVESPVMVAPVMPPPPTKSVSEDATNAPQELAGDDLDMFVRDFTASR